MLNRAFIRQVGMAKWAGRMARRQFTSRILRRDSCLTLPTGLTIVLPRHSESATEVYVTNGDIDWGSEALFARFAERDRDALDVGAHIGYYAVYLSPLVRRVYAFEPDPRNLAALRLNARAAGNIEVIDAAVSSSTGVTPLHLGVGSATTSLRPQANRPVIQVPTTSIDAFWSGHPSIDPALIKTDIEGHDLEALRGMTQVVARSQPLILTECDQPSDLGSLCRDWGYAIFAYTRSDPFAAASFRQMRAADFSLQFKMLFLVPARLSPHFMALTVGG